MDARPSIWKVVYRQGLITDPSDWRGLTTTVLEGSDLSGEVVDAILGNDLLAAGGDHGIPQAGDPMEINSLQILHEHGITEITVYNLGIMLFYSNDTIYPRVLRVCSAIEKQIEGRSGTKKSVDRAVPKTVARPNTQVRPRPEQEGKRIYQIRVALLETDPQVWRRFLVPANVTLHRLHLILQDVMGWTNSHLYRFKLGAKEYAVPDPDDDFNELDFKDSRRAKLGRLVTNKGTAFLYEYDFGDSWNHMLLVEDILECDPSGRYPACIAGERACPPEDCGGTRGYMQLLGIIANPDHEEYLDTMRWLGAHFAPSSFELEAVNRRLCSMHV